MPKFIGAIDQGTTSTRFIVFDHEGNIVAIDQKEHKQFYPAPGLVEHDGMEIWTNTLEVIIGGMRKSGLASEDIAAIGVTNHPALESQHRTALRECHCLARYPH